MTEKCETGITQGGLERFRISTAKPLVQRPRHYFSLLPSFPGLSSRFFPWPVWSFAQGVATEDRAPEGY